MDVFRITDHNKLLKEAASLIVNIAQTSVKDRGFFSLVVAGGNTPRALYKTLANEEFCKQMPWDKTFFFWGDERFVPKDHPESNYHMVDETLLSHIPVSWTHIFPIPTHIDFDNAAKEYESILRRFFKGKDNPSFDLFMLGIGDDGHVVSLFNNDPALEEKHLWVRAVIAPESYPVRKRITLTLPIINCARNVLFLVTGEKKSGILSNVLNGKGDYPANLVQPSGSSILFTDVDA
ncbi:MAG: 6-phosphogluconolactonase [Spirochaetota bacterium]|nr:MAG: 6-phosphogluconolactonase [Spirochaetota bacterium]